VFSLCPLSLRMLGDVTQQRVAITWIVFSVDPASAPMDWLGSNHMTRVFCAWSVPRGYLEDIRRYSAVENSVLYGRLWRKEIVSRVRLWRENFMCNIWSVQFSETLIVPVLQICRQETDNEYFIYML
jgi:hypothetical protein